MATIAQPVRSRARPEEGAVGCRPASRQNGIIDWLVSSHKATVAVNWGLAAVVYAVIGGFIARLLRR
jgi:hypothetical protein